MTEEGDQQLETTTETSQLVSPKPSRNARAYRPTMITQQEYMVRHLHVMETIRDELRLLNQTIGERIVFNIADTGNVILMQDETVSDEVKKTND